MEKIEKKKKNKLIKAARTKRRRQKKFIIHFDCVIGMDLVSVTKKKQQKYPIILFWHDTFPAQMNKNRIK